VNYDRQIHSLVALNDATLSESHLLPGRAAQLNMAIMRLLLVHALMLLEITPTVSLTELLSSNNPCPGKSYSRFLQMFKPREQVLPQTCSHEGIWKLEDYLGLSPLSQDATECCGRLVLSDDQLLQFADAIERISLPSPSVSDSVDPTTMLGSVYELLKDRNTKKEGGVFYTPNSVAGIICDLGLSSYQPTWVQTTENIDPRSLDQLLGLRVVDDACGCGVFLLAMLHRMVRLVQKAVTEIPGAAQVLEVQGVNPDDTSSLAQYVMRNNLHGRDLDKTALTIAKTQLWLAICAMQPNHMPLPSPDIDLIVMDSLFSNTGQADMFDIVVGNPPYMKVSSLPERVKAHLRDRYPIHGEYNSHALFVHSALSQLRENGILAYIVHKNMFTLDSFSDLRRLLLDSYQCVELIDCGPGLFKRVTAETGVIVVRKAAALGLTNVTLSKYSKSVRGVQPILEIPQADYLALVRPWKYRYFLNVNEEDRPVLSLLEKLPRLNEFVSIRRGIETGHNRQFLASSTDQRGNWRPVLRGRDVSAFRCRPRLYLDYRRDKLSKPGPTGLLQKPKIVLQQNSRYPIAFFDDGRFLVLNSATYVSGAQPDILKALCVFLNSRLVAWFFRKVVTNDARLTVNLLPNNLGIIPVPMRFDAPVLAWLCDMLTALYAEPEQSSIAETESLRNAADAAVLETYFPQLFPKMDTIRTLSSAANRAKTSKSLVAARTDIILRARVVEKTFDAPIVKAITNLTE